MSDLRKCSGCKRINEITHFGINRQGDPYKTCNTCRNKKKHVEVKQKICKEKTFLDNYVNLPIFNFENIQDVDINIDSIVVLNHIVEFFNNKIFRNDGEIWKYKEFTELDPIEYYEGTDAVMEYMPDEYVAPVLVKINGVTHRGSALTWFPLTDFADAIKWKQHVTNKTTYPIHIEKHKYPIHEVRKAIGGKFWELLPPTVTDIQMKEIKESIRIKQTP